MKHPVLLCLLVFILPLTASAQANRLRSFEEIFPNLGESRKREIFSPEGTIRSARRNEPLEFIPAPGSGIDLPGAILKTDPSYLTESLLVIPYRGKTLNKLDIYNALGNIRDLKGRLYRSHSRNAEVPLFEEATRIESARKTTPIPDPLPANEFPLSETIYLRLKDVNFGNSYYRGEMIVNSYGISYNLTNIKDLSYLLFTVIKEEKFSAQLYLEPLAEGVLIYSMAGAEASAFVPGRIGVSSAIRKRLAVFIAWVSDNLESL